MADPIVSEFMSHMAAGFKPEKAAGIDTSIQLNLTGAEAGEWVISIRDNQCTINVGTSSDTRLKINVDSENFKKIFTGQMDALQAYMHGKIRVTGDLNLAMRLLGMFKMK